MPQNSTDQPPRYHTFLLSLWEEHSDGLPVWRFSLENPHTGERLGFKALDEMVAYLRVWVQRPASQTTPSAL